MDPDPPQPTADSGHTLEEPPATVAVRGGRRTDVAVALVIVLQFIARTTLAARGSWTWDDWGFLYAATTRTFGPDDWFSVYGGQFHPFLWPLFDLQQWVAPGSYPAAAVLVGLLEAISVLLVYLVLRRLFGARLILVTFVVWFAFTPLTLESRLWVTVAFYTLPFQISFAAALLLFLRYLEAPSRRRAALVVLGQIAALLCWQKAVYIPVAFFVLAAWAPLSGRAIGWRDALHRFRPLWVGLLTANGAYLALYVWLSRVNATPYGLAGLPGLRDLLEAGWLITRSFSVSLVGGPWQWDRPIVPVPDPPLLLSLVSLAALAGLVAWCWRTRRAVLALWLLVGALLTLDFALIAFGRLENLASIRDVTYLRYLADLAIPTVLALAFTFLRPPSSPTPATSPPGEGAGSGHRVVAGVLLSVFFVSAVVSSAFLLREWGRHPGAAYVANIRSALEDRSSSPHLLVQDVPSGVNSPLFAPYNTTPVVIAVLEQEATFLEYIAGSDHLIGVLPSGEIGPVEIGPTPFTVTYWSEPGPGVCGWPLTTTPTVVPLTTMIPGQAVPAGRWYAQVRLTSSGPTAVNIAIGQTRLRAEVAPGSSDLYFSLIGPAEGIRLRVDDADAETCVHSVLVGQLVGRSS